MSILGINTNAMSIQKNIYVGKLTPNTNPSKDSLKVVSSDVIFTKSEIDEEMLKNGGVVQELTSDELSAVLKGDSKQEQKTQTVDKFLVNLTYRYAKEKQRIETTMTGNDKKKELSLLNQKFYNTVEKFGSLYDDKILSGGDPLHNAGITLSSGTEDYSVLAESVRKLSYKAKEYIDKGNNPPTNEKEFEKFSEFVSKCSSDDLNNLSLKDLNTFDKIATNMEYDGTSFLKFNQNLDGVDLPKGLVDILRKSSITKIEFPKSIDFDNFDPIAFNKKVNENKKYFDSLVSSETKRQAEKKLQDFVDFGRGIKVRHISSFNTNTPAKDLFASIKTAQQKYGEFIAKNKFKVSTDPTVNVNMAVAKNIKYL